MSTQDVIDLITGAGPMTIIVIVGLLVWKGDLHLRREDDQRRTSDEARITELREALREANAQNVTLQKEARLFTRDSMEEMRKQREALFSEISEIRKTMHALIATLPEHSDTERAP